MTVGEKFSTFLGNLALTSTQRDDGVTKHTGVRSCLNGHYYGTSSGYSNSILVGSLGKDTQIRPPRDIDVLFELPASVYERYQQRPGNKQSQLLQEVKGVLGATYPSTTMRADGQVVVVPFASYAVEVVPAFKLTSGQYWICDTSNGGRYKPTAPEAEVAHLRQSDGGTKGNTRDLIRMSKCWQGHCSVPLKSFWIELIAIDFINTWAHKGNSTVYYDWMVRDLFGYLKGRARGYVFAPGTAEMMYLGDVWLSRAETAHGRAEKACKLEASSDADAGIEWQKIFGTYIPL